MNTNNGTVMQAAQAVPAAGLREDLIANAVEFLVDKSIASSPLAKKIEFIESKGLTQEEIQEALTRAQAGSTQGSNNTTTNTTTTNLSHAPPPPLPDYYYNAPPLPERDWKDYFVMATAAAGVTYGMYQIVKRYVVPKIIPPSKTEIENDKEAISLEFNRIEKLLESFEKQQIDFYEKQEAKSNKLDETLSEIDEIINRTNEKNLSNEETLKYLKLEIENIKNILMKSLDSQKSTLTQELTHLETDLNDLKFQLKHLSMNSNSNSNLIGTNQLSTPPSEQITKPDLNTVSTGSSSNSIASVAQQEAKASLLNLNIPPATSVPSLKDILQKEKEKTLNESPFSSSKSESPVPSVESSSSQPASASKKGIPAWQLAA